MHFFGIQIDISIKQFLHHATIVKDEITSTHHQTQSLIQLSIHQ